LQLPAQWNETLRSIDFIRVIERDGYVLATVVQMQVEIDDRIIERVQELVPVRLTEADHDFYADWLAGLGLGLVNASLQKHPELTFGDLLMVSLRNQKY
jgi:hypothetical protein